MELNKGNLWPFVLNQFVGELDSSLYPIYPNLSVYFSY